MKAKHQLSFYNGWEFNIKAEYIKEIKVLLNCWMSKWTTKRFCRQVCTLYHISQKDISRELSAIHPAGRTLIFDWSQNSFWILEFFKFRQNFRSKAWLNLVGILVKNSNCLLFESLCFLVNKFGHSRGKDPVQKGTGALYGGVGDWGPLEWGSGGLQPRPSTGSRTGALYRDSSSPHGQTEWQTDRHNWKHYLHVTSLADGKNFPRTTITELFTDPSEVSALPAGCNRHNVDTISIM